MTLRHLESLNSREFKLFLDSFDNVLCDCDGVLWLVNTPVPGVKESLSKLRECGKRIRFVSNNSLIGIERFQRKFDDFQFDSTTDDVAYPSLAIIDYLKSIDYQKEIYILGSPVMKKEFQDAGLKIADLPDRVNYEVSDLKILLEDNENIGAVVVDIDLNLSYAKLLKASAYLRRPDVLFITGATDKEHPIGPKAKFMGPAYFQEALSSFVNRTPIGFGKPSVTFNKYILKKFNIEDSSRVLFIGDSLEQDIEFASKCGYQKLLVLTGVASLEQVTQCMHKNMIPDYYMNSFGDLQQLIKNKLNI